MNAMRSIRLAVLSAAVLAGTALAACGRKGDLDRPGVTSSNAAGTDGKKQPVEDRPFLLDPLL